MQFNLRLRICIKKK